MRRMIVLGAAAIAAFGCSTPGPARTAAGPDAPTVPMATEAPAMPGSHALFSRAAVPDAVMLRDQAGSRDWSAP